MSYCGRDVNSDALSLKLDVNSPNGGLLIAVVVITVLVIALLVPVIGLAVRIIFFALAAICCSIAACVRCAATTGNIAPHAATKHSHCRQSRHPSPQ